MQTELVADALPAYSEEALALAFAEKYADRLRYVAAWGKWLHWNGSVWEPDTTLLTLDLARQLCREVAVKGQSARAASIASSSMVYAVQRLAQADRRLAATAGEWDADPLLLNTRAGMVDLRSGEMRPHDPKAGCTKITAVGPGGDCSRWLAFLNRIMAGDEEMIGYLQRVLGYTLTGYTREQTLWFLYGTGANGKSVFLSTVTGILGGYGKTVAAETFTATKFDRHPTELAALDGPRLIAASETEEGRDWAESRIKTITGGEKISARFMRRDLFEFVPVFKLFIAGNHRPRIKNVDEAMRRRIHLVPFAVTIPPSERDPNLGAALMEEWPGILQWMIDGSRAYLRDRLRAPQKVVAASGEYFEAEDNVSVWLGDRCELGGTRRTHATQLWDDWQSWAIAAGEEPHTQRWLTEKLKARGTDFIHTKKGNAFSGIVIRSREGLCQGDAG